MEKSLEAVWKVRRGYWKEAGLDAGRVHARESSRSPHRRNVGGEEEEN